MSDAIEARKARLRQDLAEAARGLDPAERQRLSERACARLREQPVWQTARAILFYAPLRSEVDLWPLLSEALGRGLTVALPRFVPASGVYEAAVIRSPERDLIAGQFGIREPGPGCQVWPLNRLDLVLAPGVGFDLDGRRLGRGQGYYDRLLSLVDGLRCGVAMDRQVLPRVPAAPHDVAVDCLLTPTRWLNFHRRAA
jgi:5-formyltetrahydrofolate cyclo-ligase